MQLERGYRIEALEVSDKSLIGAKIAVVPRWFFGMLRFYDGRPINGIFMIKLLADLAFGL